MTVDQLVTLFLAILGVVLSLVFRYVAPARAWFDSQVNKGLLMLAFVIVIAGVYFALACSSLAPTLNIPLACTDQGAWDLVKAVFIIATGNQLTFLYTKG